MQVTAQEMDRGELLAHSSSPPHRRVGIQADVFFGCRKLNQILLFPVSRHTPGNLLHSVRQCVFDGIMDLTEIWLDIFRLLCNIFFNVLRGITEKAAVCHRACRSLFNYFIQSVSFQRS